MIVKAGTGSLKNTEGVVTMTQELTLAEQMYQRIIKAVEPNGKSVPGLIREQEIEATKKRWKDERRENFEIGEKNRKFYAEQSAKTGTPWHHNTRSNQQYSEFVLLTPEMASVLLQHNPRNRRLKRATLEAYKRDMLNDNWVQTDEAIGIDKNGNMYNGQHRVTAVLQSGKSVVFYFTFNVPIEAKFVVDSGVKRSTTEKLSYIMDNPIGDKMAAVSRAMMRGLAPYKVKHTDSELAAFSAKYAEIIEWTCKSIPKVRADVQAAVAKSALWYGREAIETFCERFRTLMFNSTSDPAAVLYKYLAKNARGVHSSIIYGKTLAAIEHHLANREVRSLFEREVDVFEWSPNWEVPTTEET